MTSNPHLNALYAQKVSPKNSISIAICAKFTTKSLLQRSANQVDLVYEMDLIFEMQLCMNTSHQWVILILEIWVLSWPPPLSVPSSPMGQTDGYM